MTIALLLLALVALLGVAHTLLVGDLGLGLSRRVTTLQSQLLSALLFPLMRWDGSSGPQDWHAPFLARSAVGEANYLLLSKQRHARDLVRFHLLPFSKRNRAARREARTLSQLTPDFPLIQVVRTHRGHPAVVRSLCSHSSLGALTAASYFVTIGVRHHHQLDPLLMEALWVYMHALPETTTLPLFGVDSASLARALPVVEGLHGNPRLAEAYTSLAPTWSGDLADCLATAELL